MATAKYHPDLTVLMAQGTWKRAPKFLADGHPGQEPD
jgi:hypothetical protein